MSGCEGRPVVSQMVKLWPRPALPGGGGGGPRREAVLREESAQPFQSGANFLPWARE
jgi:hypothetical protein